jgi:hypothetical protein
MSITFSSVDRVVSSSLSESLRTDLLTLLNPLYRRAQSQRPEGESELPALIKRITGLDTWGGTQEELFRWLYPLVQQNQIDVVRHFLRFVDPSKWENGVPDRFFSNPLLHEAAHQCGHPERDKMLFLLLDSGIWNGLYDTPLKRYQIVPQYRDEYRNTFLERLRKNSRKLSQESRDELTRRGIILN